MTSRRAPAARKPKTPKTKPARAPARPRAKVERSDYKAPRWHLIPKPATRRQRVEHIADIMSLGEWITRQSTKALAAHWKVTYSTVEADAVKASKIVRRAHGKRLAMVTSTVAKIERAYEGAMAYGQFSAAVRACSEMIRVLGPSSPSAPGRGAPRGEGDEAPAGLPPELARLDPAPTVDELRHFVEVTREACTVEACRVHRPPAADAPLH